MTKDINIGGVVVPMCATALAPIQYRNVFGEDLIKQAQEYADGDFGVGAYELYAKLGFIFAKRAEGADISKISLKDFEAWMEEFSFLDICEAAGDIATLYTASSKGTSNPKK